MQKIDLNHSDFKVFSVLLNFKWRLQWWFELESLKWVPKDELYGCSQPCSVSTKI